jgi:hypothetical protein
MGTKEKNEIYSFQETYLAFLFLPKICYILLRNYTSINDTDHKINYHFQLALCLSYLTHSHGCGIAIYCLKTSKTMYTSRDSDGWFHDSINFWEESIIASE